VEGTVQNVEKRSRWVNFAAVRRLAKVSARKLSSSAEAVPQKITSPITQKTPEAKSSAVQKSSVLRDDLSSASSRDSESSLSSGERGFMHDISTAHSNEVQEEVLTTAINTLLSASQNTGPPSPPGASFAVQEFSPPGTGAAIPSFAGFNHHGHTPTLISSSAGVNLLLGNTVQLRTKVGNAFAGFQVSPASSSAPSWPMLQTPAFYLPQSAASASSAKVPIEVTVSSGSGSKKVTTKCGRASPPSRS